MVAERHRYPVPTEVEVDPVQLFWRSLSSLSPLSSYQTYVVSHSLYLHNHLPARLRKHDLSRLRITDRSARIPRISEEPRPHLDNPNFDVCEDVRAVRSPPQNLLDHLFELHILSQWELKA